MTTNRPMLLMFPALHVSHGRTCQISTVMLIRPHKLTPRPRTQQRFHGIADVGQLMCSSIIRPITIFIEQTNSSKLESEALY